MVRTTVLILCLCLAIPFFGCRGKSGSSVAPEQIKIELWDEQVKITGLESFHVEFKYRFVQGKPQPDRDYLFELEMGMLYTLKKVRGTDLKPEGQFQLDLPLFREGKAYTMKVMQSGPNAVFTYQPVSNELKGTLQPRLVK